MHKDKKEIQPMRKIVLSDGSGRWFDADRAKKFEAKSIISHGGEEICRATNVPGLWENLYLTQHGSFVLVRTYDGYAPDAEGAVEMEVTNAVRWLVSNGHGEEVKKMDLATEEAQLEL
jgi:hypothetical protein